MNTRYLVPLLSLSLLAACSSDEPKPVLAPKAPVAARQPTAPGPLPAYQREISGTLLGIPSGAEVELALLVIDERGRPQRLLASSNLSANGQDLPFQLRFNPEVFPAGARVDLRVGFTQDTVILKI